MTTGASYTLVRDWVETQSRRELPELAGLEPHQKLLLLSDGSMTLDLELLYGSAVEVEVQRSACATLSPHDAAYLDEEPDMDVTEREVWLTVGRKKLVWAHSLIPSLRVSPEIKEALDANTGEPIGRVLTEHKVFFSKSRLDVAVVACAHASKDLNLPPDTPLVARRYILSNMQDKKWIIKASITEIFSPGVISARLLKNGHGALG